MLYLIWIIGFCFTLGLLAALASLHEEKPSAVAAIGVGIFTFIFWPSILGAYFGSRY